MRTIKCKDCGIDVQTIANNTTRCKACSLEAKRAAKRKWDQKATKPCECEQGPRVSKWSGCAACNAKDAIRYGPQMRREIAQAEESLDDEGSWRDFCEQWKREEWARQGALRRVFNSCAPLSQQL